jgi:mRNA-degrading endonuclease RelE of RelBE toxin-antitoxin system
MSWEVIISPNMEEDLEELENEVSKRIKSKLADIREQANKGVNPEHYLKWINKYEIHRLRTGDYRTFIDLDHEGKQIKALTARKRDKAYKGWS